MSLKFQRSDSSKSRPSVGGRVSRPRAFSAQVGRGASLRLLEDRGLTLRQHSSPMSYKDYLRMKVDNQRNKSELEKMRKENRSMELRYARYREMQEMLSAGVVVNDRERRQTIVPRDAKTERRCQLFSIIVTILCLLAIFFFAMTHSVWSSVIMADNYKSYCSVTDVIPLEGTADCKSVRSRTKTEVQCTITCNYGIDTSQTDEHFVATGNSFNMSCDVAKDSWSYDVMKICLSSAEET